jgi:hypothetical protein
MSKSNLKNDCLPSGFSILRRNIIFPSEKNEVKVSVFFIEKLSAKDCHSD